MLHKILSRLDIIGDLNYDCPKCILEDIISSSGTILQYTHSEDKYLYRHKLLILARKVQPIRLDENGLRRAATYINPNRDILWEEKDIRKSLAFLETFYNRDVLTLIPIEFNYGYQEPKNSTRINIAILYKASLELGIRSSYDTTVDNIIDSIRVYHMNLDMKKALLTIVGTLNDNTIRSLLLEISILENSPIIDSNISRDRALEGINVTIHPKISSGESLYDKFDPTIPEDFYSEECLQYYRDKYHIEGSYDIVLRTLTEPTWHKFDPLLSIADDTPIYRTDISSHMKKDLYQYGIIGTPMESFSEDSLVAYFESTLSLIHPTDRDILMTDFVMERLEHISSSRMRAAIHRVNSYLSAASEQQQEFMIAYNDSPNKETIVKFLWRLHDVGMAMRGWDMISTDLPISKSQPDNQFDVDVNVTASIARLEELQLPPIILSLILNLPTLRMTKGNLQVGNPSDPGYTIGNRIDLIKSGNQDDINTCIRINSNWIVASSYVYLNCIGQHILYSLDDLREIS